VTKHALAKKLAHYHDPKYAARIWAGDPVLKARGAKRHRKTWLAKQHRKAIEIALATKRNREARRCRTTRS
jgi:hypothetical protein